MGSRRRPRTVRRPQGEDLAIDTVSSHSTERRVLVTGATGMIGRAVLDALPIDRPARVLVRNPDTFRSPRELDVRVGDFDDPDSLGAALEDVHTAFLVTNSSERVERQQLNFVDAAERAGVDRIVYLSQLNSRADSVVRFLRYHAAVEERIAGSSMTLVSIRPNLVLQAFLDFAPVLRSGSLPGPIGDARVSMVDVRDVAAVSAAALMNDTWSGILDVTGPRAVTHTELASALTASTGIQIGFDEVAPTAYLAMLRGSGMPGWQADGVLEDYAHYSRGEATEVSPMVERVTGRPARSLDDFARDYADVIRG